MGFFNDRSDLPLGTDVDEHLLDDEDLDGSMLFEPRVLDTTGSVNYVVGASEAYVARAASHETIKSSAGDVVVFRAGGCFYCRG